MVSLAPRNGWTKPLAIIGLLTAFVLTVTVGQVFSPDRAPPTPVTPVASWITAQFPSNRVFLRQVIDLPFVPVAAWIGISADDYTLYVNGQRAARNTFAVNAGLSFQHVISDRQQGVNA